MISVIINAEKNTGYLRRCLCSLKKQDHSKFEVIILGKNACISEDDTGPVSDDHRTTVLDMDKVSEIFDIVKGGSIFFCNASSIFSGDLLSNAYKKLKETSSCVSSDIFLVDSGHRSSVRVTNRLSLSGKLFSSDALKKALLKKGEMSPHLKHLRYEDIYLRCAEVFDLDDVASDCILYETDEALCPDFSVSFRDRDYKRLITAISKSKVSSSDVFEVLRQWLGSEKCDAYPESRKILYMASAFEGNTEIQYELFTKYIKKIHDSGISDKKEKDLSAVRSFLKLNEKNTALMEMITGELGTDRGLFRILTDQKYKDYILLYKKRHRQDADGARANVPVAGHELSEFIIGQYGSGNLGLKTILRSLKAYTENKIKTIKG